MIKVNGSDFKWKENLTVENILVEKKYTFPKIIVRINGKVILSEKYSETIINDGDNVQVIHLIAGG